MNYSPKSKFLKFRQKTSEINLTKKSKFDYIIIIVNFYKDQLCFISDLKCSGL